MKYAKLRALLIYPQYPDTFWSLRHALRVICKKAAFPPLGLLTVSSMLPQEWEKKLIDMNATLLTDKDIRWADYVFVSAMVVQRESAMELIRRCKKLRVRMVAGGPLFTSEYEKFE
ncbi:MAG: cobalamin B12-binding domain-containing protein, partial [Dehalococcoidales bacterium]|nr:cobalamin B12-binding domain-containing protein [Dehalococcoidales bacterium]